MKSGSLSSQLLIGIAGTVLILFVLSCGCTQPSAPGEGLPAAPTTLPSPAGTQAAGPSNSLEAYIVLGQMHADMVESVEEAFAYPLLGDPAEKEDFLKKNGDFLTMAAEFEEKAALDDPGNAVLRKEFDDLIVMHASFQKSAMAMFGEFEENGSVTDGTLVPLEKDVDAVLEAFDGFSADYLESLGVGPFSASPHHSVVDDLLRMHEELFEGVEEAFGYMLLKDPSEKEDFYSYMTNFDAQAAVVEKVIPKGGPHDRFIDMIAAKAEMQAAATKMFASFEATGSADKADVLAFEESVDKVSTIYDEMMATLLAKIPA